MPNVHTVLHYFRPNIRRVFILVNMITLTEWWHYYWSHNNACIVITQTVFDPDQKWGWGHWAEVSSWGGSWGRWGSGDLVLQRRRGQGHWKALHDFRRNLRQALRSKVKPVGLRFPIRKWRGQKDNKTPYQFVLVVYHAWSNKFQSMLDTVKGTKEQKIVMS